MAQFLSTPSVRRATVIILVFLGVHPISIHALREEGDYCKAVNTAEADAISIHALREEGDPRAAVVEDNSAISIHALREEGDQHEEQQRGKKTLFLSTPSVRRATKTADRGGRAYGISIHALREEGDPAPPAPSCPRSYFYPRPP